MAVRSGTSLAAIGAEAPEVALEVADAETPRPVVLVDQAANYLCPGADGAPEQCVRVVAYDVNRVVSRGPLAERGVVLSRGPEHHPASQRPTQFGVLDDAGIVVARVARALLESEGVDEELLSGDGVAVGEDGPDGGVLGHAVHGRRRNSVSLVDSIELRPRGVGDVLDVGFRIFRARFGDLAKAVAVIVVPVSVLTSVLLLLVTPTENPFGRLSDPEFTESVTSVEQLLAEIDGGAVALLIGGFFLTGILSALAAQLATAATFKIIARGYLGLPQDWRDSVAFAGRRFWPLIWLQVVYGFFLTLAFLALVIPGIYLVVAWTVAIPVLMFENVRGRRALSRSRELLRGRWWPTAGLLVLLSILTGLVSALITQVLFAVLPANGDLVEAVAQGLAGSVGSVLTTPFAAAAITVLFFDALVRKEHFDEVELADAMGVGQAFEFPLGRDAAD